MVRTKKKYGRPDGSFIRFDDNACVLINKNGDPLGTRLNGQYCIPIVLPMAIYTDGWASLYRRGRCGAEEYEVVKDSQSSSYARINIQKTFIDILFFNKK